MATDGAAVSCDVASPFTRVPAEQAGEVVRRHLHLHIKNLVNPNPDQICSSPGLRLDMKKK